MAIRPSDGIKSVHAPTAKASVFLWEFYLWNSNTNQIPRVAIQRTCTRLPHNVFLLGLPHFLKNLSTYDF